MWQLIYVSSAHPKAGPVDAESILAVSRRNNLRDAITGMLYSDGARFLQVLEGDRDKVEAVFARVSADERHRAIVVLSRREVTGREFGGWEMAHRTSGEDADAFIARIADIVAGASEDVRATFEGFAEVRRAA